MKAKFLRLALLFFLIVATTNCSRRTDSLKIATAANMQFAMEELISAFEKEKGIEADLILSSSGKLTAQIEAGAPFDLFFSADTKYPNELAYKGLSERPIIYAYGQLVFWEKGNSQEQLYAMANPLTAPYGLATEEYIKAKKIYLPDVVYGESISQVNQFLLSGTVDGGFTSLSSVLSDRFTDGGKWTIVADSLHSPIRQAMVILKKSERTGEARAFMAFVQSVEGQEILKRYGYK